MVRYPLKIVTAQQMRDLERRAHESGHTYVDMMERAGRAVASVIRQDRPPTEEQRVLVLAGPGNNGGDGLVAARYLAQQGYSVRVYCVRRSPEGDVNYGRLQDLGVDVAHAEADEALATLQAWLDEADILVDALLGTGVSRPIEGLMREALDLARRHLRTEGRAFPSSGTEGTVWPAAPTVSASARRPLVVAVDCPSGLNCDTGALDPAAIPADVTVTFAYPKAGHFLFPGAAAVGALAVADIGIHPAFAEAVSTEVVTGEAVVALLPDRPLDAHKGTFGKALIVAGSVNYTGAAYLAAAAAARAGTGLVTVALPRPLHPILASRLAEATWLVLPHDMGVIHRDAISVLEEHLEGYRALLLGPGLTQEKEAVRFVREFLQREVAHHPPPPIGFLKEVPGTPPPPEPTAGPPWPPLVLDADALNALAQSEGWPQWLSGIRAVLTPHAGEMARLLGITPGEVQAARWRVASEAAREWNQVVVLKGAFTVIAAPDGRLAVNPFANPALATAGSGDVLAGILTGFLAQGLTPWEAAVAGAYVHGLAGELARQATGDAGVLAGDLLPRIPEALQRLYALHRT
ncbi:MAG: bifunctional ADP-dependent NAD(P)H-hydrate dehydratase/NAD(P)H-hydrate epimerase [Anaerolineae bacterium]